jgi:Family of unknown function (DUF6152)
MKIKALSLGAVALGFFTISAAAHHSFSMFDRERTVELQGTVNEFQWTNPHSFLEVSVENPQGGKTVWTIEMNGPRALISQGWRPKSVVPGDKVLLTVHPSRSGKSFAQFLWITLPDGRVLGDRGNQSAPILQDQADRPN